MADFASTGDYFQLQSSRGYGIAIVVRVAVTKALFCAKIETSAAR